MDVVHPSSTHPAAANTAPVVAKYAYTYNYTLI